MKAETQLSDSPEADAFLEDAFPTGGSTLLYSPVGPEKETIIVPLIHRALGQGKQVLVGLSNIPPRRLLKRLRVRGCNVKKELEKGKLKVLDWYSHKEEEPEKLGEEDGILRCSGSLEALEGAISTMVDSGDGEGLAVLEVLTDVLGMVEDREGFVAALLKRLREGYATAVLAVDSDLLPEAVAGGLRGQFRNALEIVRHRSHKELVWGAIIVGPGVKEKHFRLYLEAPYETFTAKLVEDHALESEGVTASDFTRKPCPECGAPLDSPECNVCGYATEDPRLAIIQAIYEDCEDRLREDPTDVDALFTKAAALARMRKYEVAVQTLNELTKLEPTYPGLWMLKAKLFDRLGDELKAGLCRQRAYELAEEESSPSFGAKVGGDSERFQCPLCQRWLPIEAKICPCGAEFEEE